MNRITAAVREFVRTLSEATTEVGRLKSKLATVAEKV